MSKRKPPTPRQKELRARARKAKSKAKPARQSIPARSSRTSAQSPTRDRRKGQIQGESGRGAAYSPFIVATRWPREIKLSQVVKRKAMGDITALAKSIDARGALLQPIVITSADELIAGQRRLEAWSLSKFAKEPIPVHVVDIDSIIAGEWDENAQRKDFTPSESVELMERLLPEAKAKAKERQRAGKKLSEGEEAGEAADHLAHYLGRDRTTLVKAKEVVDAAREHPKKFGPLLDYMDRTGKINGPWRRLKVLRQVEDIHEKKKNGTLDLPAGKYDRIVADMPWPHEIDDPDPGARGRATRPYATMSIDDMKAMPIDKRLAKDCVLYFWTTNFHMEVSYQVMRAWGFKEFPTIVTWAKDGFKRGQRLRNVTEHCIIAIKGKPVWHLGEQTTLLRGPSGENSEKPPSFYALIDEITPAQRSLELFARRELPEGWEGFGDQVGKFKAEQPEPEIETFGNIARGLLKVLGAIERGESIAFNENDHVIAGLFKGKRVRKLTKAGLERLAELRADNKFSKHAPYHIVRMTRAIGEHSGLDMSVANCECGWRSERCTDDEGLKIQNEEIGAHWHAITDETNAGAASVQLEAAE